MSKHDVIVFQDAVMPHDDSNWVSSENILQTLLEVVNNGFSMPLLQTGPFSQYTSTSPLKDFGLERNMNQAIQAVTSLGSVSENVTCSKIN